MEIKLTHQQKILLLEAVQCGWLDTSVFEKSEDERMNVEDLEREIIRLEAFDGRMLERSELMRKYALGEIGFEEYLRQRLEMGGYGKRG